MKSNKITFGFGVGVTKDGSPIPRYFAQCLVKEICELAANLFGGYTIYECEGGWTNPRGEVVVEPGRSIVAYCDHRSKVTEAKVEQMVATIKELLNQEAVAVVREECDFSIL